MPDQIYADTRGHTIIHPSSREKMGRREIRHKSSTSELMGSRDLLYAKANYHLVRGKVSVAMLNKYGLEVHVLSIPLSLVSCQALVLYGVLLI